MPEPACWSRCSCAGGSPAWPRPAWRPAQPPSTPARHAARVNGPSGIHSGRAVSFSGGVRSAPKAIHALWTPTYKERIGPVADRCDLPAVARVRCIRRLGQSGGGSCALSCSALPRLSIPSCRKSSFELEC
jgi:hypothetical protein